MPNLTVPAAATGLPFDLAAIMRAAHDLAHAMPGRIPYADRLAGALRRSWNAAKASFLTALREIVAERVERLVAFLDALDGDTDLEPDLAGVPNAGAASDAEGDDSDLEPDVDDEWSGDETEPALGWPEVADGRPSDLGSTSDREEQAPAAFDRARRAVNKERDAMVDAQRDLRRIRLRGKGSPIGNVGNLIPLFRTSDGRFVRVIRADG